ncbi:hypothetical protein QTI66_31740 [Variovorax sp. J22R133]|uniref:hypothetical protein n=1 Tax=Variovorax brevis TaxID=3053503 RepID=UPI0025764240|nr:hypothetical protein [Variovorax sp. J22R133]MDM0116713.1 hypothetical protein [Variovorax sp. J22R133]
MGGLRELGHLHAQARSETADGPGRQSDALPEVAQSYGGERTTFGEVEAIEGKGPQGQSILLGPIDYSTCASHAKAAGPESAARQEREPNNTLAQAEFLEPGVAVGGAVAPGNDQDFFRIKGSAGTQQQAVTVDVHGPFVTLS